VNVGQTLSAIVAQARAELLLTLRRGESVLVTVLIPLGLLIFFASAAILPARARSVSFLLSGTVALAIISTGMVSLGIATAYERYYGVLKLLGATPLPRWALIAAKLLAVAAIEALQIVILVLVAMLAYGWRPGGEVGAQLLALLLGSVAFAGLGLAMAGRLRAEVTLGVANGLFLVLLLLGGLFVPLDRLPGVVGPIARLLPANALAEALRGAAPVSEAWLVLVAWALLAPAVAALTFRWE
jgi:ABC-2 type transport system permease protein